MSTDDISNLKPLSDSDVEIRRKRMANANTKLLNEIFNEYHNTIKMIITSAEKILAADGNKDEEDEVELSRIKRIVNLSPSDEILIRSMDKVWSVKNHIMTKNSDYFLKKDYSNLVKNDEKKAMIVNLIMIIREMYDKLKPKEQNLFWSYGLTLLKLVANCKKLIGEE